MEEILNEHERWGHGEGEPEHVPIAELIRESVAALDARRRTFVSLEWGKAPDVSASVRANRILLRRVFTVLLKSAAEAVQRSGVRNALIRLDAYLEESGEGDQAHILLCNSAVSFDAERARKMFGRRAHDEPSRGTGLHWCANALALMNAAIAVESGEDGKGTCFHIRLPA